VLGIHALLLADVRVCNARSDGSVRQFWGYCPLIRTHSVQEEKSSVPKLKLRPLIIASCTVGAIAALTVAPALAVGLPGTTIGDNCSSYKQIPNDPEYISYYRCNDGSTVKIVTYLDMSTATSTFLFQYTEFRDPLGNLVESRFGREPIGSDSVVPLADSVSP
jgi:hypothetical protein